MKWLQWQMAFFFFHAYNVSKHEKAVLRATVKDTTRAVKRKHPFGIVKRDDPGNMGMRPEPNLCRYWMQLYIISCF